jgi:hypothetical protein
LSAKTPLATTAVRTFVDLADVAEVKALEIPRARAIIACEADDGPENASMGEQVDVEEVKTADSGYFKLNTATGSQTRALLCSLVANSLGNNPKKRVLAVLPTDQILHDFRRQLRALAPDCRFGDLGKNVDVETITVAKLANRIGGIDPDRYALIAVDELYSSQLKHVGGIVDRFSSGVPVLHVVSDPGSPGNTFVRVDESAHPSP